MCIYGMEGPGGYQFVGRTIQMWNRYRSTDSFEPGRPWLLRFFDQVKFYPVSAEEILQLRHDFPQGRYTPKIEETHFRLRDYQAFLEAEAEDIETFRKTQRQAFAEERARWEAKGINLDSAVELTTIEETSDWVLEDGHEVVHSPVSGSLWKMLMTAGDTVEAGQVIALVEAMKMEIQIHSPTAGTVSAVRCREGQTVSPGQTLATISPC